MDVHGGARGLLRWLLGAPPPPGPHDDRPVRADSGRDFLLSVKSAADARAALDTAESVVVVDGRATAWGVLAQLLNLGAFVALFVVMGRDAVTAVVGFLVFVGVGVLSDICQRASGVQLSPARGRVIVAGLVVGLAAVTTAIVVDLPDSWFFGFLAAVFVGATMAPVVRWFRSSRSNGHRAWGPGTEAFAILSLLDRSQAMNAAYLLARAGLEPEAGALWIERLRADHLLMGGRARRRPLGPAWIEITDTGRERLARMRAELEAQAAAELPVA